MSNHVGELDDGNAGLELLDNKGVAEIINFGAFNACDTEVAVIGCADVADQERIPGLGDKEGGIFGLWAFADVFLDRFLAGFIERDFAGIVGFKGTDFEV